MERFIKSFRRDRLGAWTCVTATELTLPTGRIQIAPLTRLTLGTTFMGIDLAKLLDEEYDCQNEGA